jgi:hypothetical protein
MGIEHSTMIKREIPRQMANDCIIKLRSIIFIIAISNILFASGSTASSAISTMMYGNLAINIVL